MGEEAVARAFEAIDAAVAVLFSEVSGAGGGPFAGGDPLRGLADGCLDILSGVAGSEARLAALKARAVATFADASHLVAPPAASVQGTEMAVAAEIAGVLAIGERAAGALLNQSQVLATMLPLTFTALQSGTLSWQHARVRGCQIVCVGEL